MPSLIPQFVARAGRTSAWLALHHRFLEAHERGDMAAIDALIDEKYELETEARGPAASTVARRRHPVPAHTTTTPATMTASAIADARARHGLLRRPPARQETTTWKLPPNKRT